MGLSAALCLIWAILPILSAYNILALTPHTLASLSHKKSILPIAKRLAKSGHEVVFWSPAVNEADLMTSLPAHIEDRVSLVNANGSKVLSGLPAANSDKAIGAALWAMKGATPIFFLIPHYFNCEICQLLLTTNRSEFDNILTYKQWDLVILDSLYTPCAYLVVEKLKVPFIVWSTTLMFISTTKALGLPLLSANYPVIMDKAEVDTNTFEDRLRSSWCGFVFSPLLIVVEWTIRRSFAGLHDSFTLTEFEQQATLASTQLSNRLDWPLALLPNMEIFASHCGQTGGHPLPPDILSFVEDPQSSGTILIAFGHGIKWSSAPSSSLEAFESALNRLTQYRVIWQSDLISNSSAQHILRREWLPQVDILHHPKTKVFVSHTGAKSLLESICAGVPLVAMPQYAEQYRNTAIVHHRKIGRFLDKFRLTGDLVYDTIVDVATNQLYSDNIRKSKDFFQDTIVHPDDLAVFHIEKSVRRAEAMKLLRSRGALLSTLVYYSLDVVVCMLATITVVFSLFILACKRLICVGRREKLD